MFKWAILLLLAASGFTQQTATAQEDSSFYSGKAITLVLGFETGGGYDAYARALARHMPNYLRGKPSIVIQNMPGAGSLRSANYLYNVAPRDGTVIGMFASSTAFEPLFGGDGAKFETAKFNWLGNMDESVGVCAVWHTSGIDRFDDLIEKKAVFGASGPAAVTSQHATALRKLLGAKIQVVQGYSGAAEAKLAMARGEVNGACGMALSSLQSQHRAEVASGQLKPIVQLGIQKHADLAGVAHVYDYAKSEEMRQIFDLVFGRHVIGRPLVAPPGLPNERVTELRRAFDATMKDPAFLEEAKRLKLYVTPSNGEGVEELFSRFFAYPKAVVEKAVAAMRE
jgi:tripartite-type tricarboxylate transporter receptor subunit TctC